MISKGIIYLAGPMSGVTWEEAKAWRDRVTQELHPMWETISPLSGQMDFFVTNTDHKETIPYSTRGDDHLPITHTATGIACQDEYYIRKSDFILANFAGAKECSFGTPWELGAAWMLGKMIVSVIEPGGPYDHLLARRRSHVFVPTLDEAIEFFKKIAV